MSCSVYQCSHLISVFFCFVLFWFFFHILASSGHGLLFKTKYEKSLSWQSSQRVIQNPEISRRGDVDVGETAVLKEAGDSAV